MTTFNIEITTQAQLDGISAARLVYNSSIPATIVDNDQNIINPDIINSDADYVQFVMNKAAESYAKQYGA